MTTPYKGNNWIGQLPAEIRQLTLERTRRRQLTKGEVIYTEGVLHTALWQITRGSVRITNQTMDGKEVVFALFSSGDCFGEISLLDGLPAANTATAVERTEVLELSKPDFDALYQQYPEFARQLTILLCGRMRHMLNFYADVTLRPLEQRLASRICYLSGGEIGGSANWELQFTQQDLAGMVGATRPAVSKLLNQWREQGIISLEYGKITVLMPAQLQAVAGRG